MYYNDTGNYKDYQEWLDKSPEWKEIKDYYFQNCGKYRCSICKVHWKLLLHKRSYQYLSLPILKKRFFYIKPLIVWWLKKHMIYLCFPHNAKVHWKGNKKIPLTYATLMKREREVRREYFWWKIRQFRPSWVLEPVGKLFFS